MEIIVHGSKIKVTEAMNDYIKEKLGKLDKYLENSENVRANVIAKVNGHQQTMEITIPLKSFILTILFSEILFSALSFSSFSIK